MVIIGNNCFNQLNGVFERLSTRNFLYIHDSMLEETISVQTLETLRGQVMSSTHTWLPGLDIAKTFYFGVSTLFLGPRNSRVCIFYAFFLWFWHDETADDMRPQQPWAILASQTLQMSISNGSHNSSRTSRGLVWKQQICKVDVKSSPLVTFISALLLVFVNWFFWKCQIELHRSLSSALSLYSNLQNSSWSHAKISFLSIIVLQKTKRSLGKNKLQTNGAVVSGIVLGRKLGAYGRLLCPSRQQG